MRSYEDKDGQNWFIMDIKWLSVDAAVQPVSCKLNFCICFETFTNATVVK